MSFEVGSIVEGKVTGITNFGAFVDIGEGKTGLVHISEVADTYVRDINEFLKESETVKVKIIDIKSDGKIGLSIKQVNGTSSSNGSANGNRRGPSRPPRRRDHRSFEQKLSRFMKDSEERLTSLKKQDSKRGGRGGRRD